MKQKDKELLRKSSLEELKKKLAEVRKELAQTIQERYTKQSKNVRKAKMIRKNIARIQTYIREKELSI
ncbi:MAG: 50S ribosomal protein L29 [Patescibacteria group bacterium]|nr:50S ribosomal protein L29 [Patescibacteria group bacterium]